MVDRGGRSEWDLLYCANGSRNQRAELRGLPWDRRRRCHLGVDALNRQGLKIANYADTSGNPTAAKVYRAAKVILSQAGIEGYMLGGFIVANQEQWHHAHGVVKALREELPKRPGFPCVILLCGNKEKESLEILKEGTKDLPGPDRDLWKR